MERTNTKNKMNFNMPHRDLEKLRKSILALSTQAGFPEISVVNSMSGGKNNRNFCISYKNNKKNLLKQYFYHPGDLRDRLEVEYNFSTFLWKNKIYCIREPLAKDSINKLSLYSYIEGRNITTNEITKELLQQAIDFLVELNSYKDVEESRTLPNASEACFSIYDHVSCVEQRLEKLKNINPNPNINREVLDFIERDLETTWKQLKKNVEQYIAEANILPDKHISFEEKCISPSDFGFHNTLLSHSNKLYFIDFEYAGFDDPAKMVCDFFCQPEVPIPITYFDFVVDKISKITPMQNFYSRVKVLLPIHKLKWCCIMLNDFLEIDGKRRAFAQGKHHDESIKMTQLNKARDYMKSIV